MKKISLSLVLSLSVFMIVISCNKDKTQAPIELCDPNKVYFEQDISPILQSNCAKSGCHDATTRAEGLNLTTYNGVMKIVKSSNASGSKLHKVITTSDPGDLMPPPPSTTLTADQISLIDKWISQGAKNEICENSATCDTTNMSFATDIQPIINTNCIGCHSSSGGTSGGYDLTTYTGVKSAVTASKLYASVAQNGAAVAMPPASKLNQCKIDQIKSWIDAGAPNN